MDYKICRKEFVESWGELAVKWGFPKSLGQIHSLLLSNNEPMTAEEIMSFLDLSRGTVSSTLRQLADAKLVSKVHFGGDRKEYFDAEREMWQILKAVIDLRKQKELDPLVALLQQMNELEANCPHSNQFKSLIKDLLQFTTTVDNALVSFASMDSKALVSSIFHTESNN